MRFSQAELDREVAVPSPLNLELRVCPTDALRQGLVGPEVDNSACIGCGLCVVRCPVGAAHLDSQTALPTFAAPLGGSAVSTTSTTDFSRLRSAATKAIRWETPPFADAGNVKRQYERFADARKANLQLTFRLLVRNTFLASGNVARLSIVGDNSAWAEVAVGMLSGSPLVGAVQIEPDDVGLDALRRLMTDLSSAIARNGLTEASLIPIVVVASQPNSRTDYYRLVADAREYLHLSIRTVPLAMLFLAIRDRSRSLLEVLATEDLGLVDVNNQSNEDQVARLFGSSARSAPGLSPSK